VFTGLTLGRGRVVARRLGRSEAELTVEPDFDWDEPLVPGESVSVSGVCLTVTRLEGTRAFTAYASSETLRRTTLGEQDDVNVERALRLRDRLGGHLVTGHVDGVGRLKSSVKVGRSLECVFTCPAELASLLIPKGSVAADGVSLTVNEVGTDRFKVNLIPLTEAMTTLSTKKPGQPVNLETDVLARYVMRLLRTGGFAGAASARDDDGRNSGGLTIADLVERGF
jgi:riboflavin synthase